MTQSMYSQACAEHQTTEIPLKLLQMSVKGGENVSIRICVK
jgi:hypothetical protein